MNQKSNQKGKNKIGCIEKKILNSIKFKVFANFPHPHFFNSRYSDDEETARCNENLDTDTPPSLAESCLRELVGRASFGHIRSVLRPLLRHLDNHHLWVPNLFATHTFKLIMYSVQVR